MSEELFNAMVRIANEAQECTSVHPRCLTLIRKLFDKHEFHIFWDAFSRIISTALAYDCKIKVIFAQNFLHFAAIFCTSYEKRNVPDDESIIESELLSTTIKFLLQAQCNADDSVRFHSCLMINKILDNLVGVELSLDLWDLIQKSMLERTRDSRVSVRIQALTALYPLQCPENPDCPVIKEYIRCIVGDSNYKVRKLCIEKVALRKDVIYVVVEQSLDVNVSVRLAVYNRALKFPNHFKIIERQALLRHGMYGESKEVELFIQEHLLPTWFHHFDNDYLKLAEALRLKGDFKVVQKSTEVIEYAIKKLMKSRPIKEVMEVLKVDEKKLLVESSLSFESVAFWKTLFQVFKDIDEYHAAEYMPEFIDLCEYIERYNDSIKNTNMDQVEYLQYQHILNQLFLIIGIYDISDVTCRQTLNQLIFRTIETSTLLLEVTQTIINCLDYTFTNIDDRIRFVVELMSEILYNAPEDNTENTMDNFELAQKKVKLHTLKYDQENAIKEQDFLKADSLKKDIEELESIIDISNKAINSVMEAEPTKKTDKPTLQKYLNICIALLKCPQIIKLDDILRSLKDDLIQDLIMHENGTIRWGAFRCYALFGLLDEQTAKVGIHLFCAMIEAYKSGQEIEVQIVLTAIDAVVDYTRLFGPDLMANPHKYDDEIGKDSFNEEEEAVFSGGSSLTSVIQNFVDFMLDENLEIQERATAALCSLLLAGRIQSSSVISRLIIKWASPATDHSDESIIVQIIGLTLQELPLSSESCTQIEQAIIPTIKTICKAPKTSPLADIDLNNIIKFLVGLTSSCPYYELIHENLAYTLCGEILNNPKKKCNLYFSKMLNMLMLCKCSKTTLLELEALCDDILENITEKGVLLNIRKLKALLIDLSHDKSTVSIVADHNSSGLITAV